MKKLNVLLTAIAMLAFGGVGLGQTGLAIYDNNVIETNGYWSRQYTNSWVGLADGKNYVLANNSARTATRTPLTGVATRWLGDDYVSLSNKFFDVTWTQTDHDQRDTTLYQFSNVKTAIVNNISIVQMNSGNEPIAYHTLLFENCDLVVVTNCFIQGQAWLPHISFENCKRVLVDNVEISGKDYSTNGTNWRAAGGLSFKGGQNSNGPPSSAHAIWNTVQNVYIHDYRHKQNTTSTDNDGIYMASPQNALIFNCYVENWAKGGPVDAAMDLGYRRTDMSNGTSRVERNVIKNSTIFKPTGTTSGANNWIVWCNNLGINTYMQHYTDDPYRVYYLHNTLIEDTNKLTVGLTNSVLSKGFMDLNADSSWRGPLYVSNNLVHVVSKPSSVTRFEMLWNNYSGASQSVKDIWTNAFYNHNCYLFNIPTSQVRWLGGAGYNIQQWSGWTNMTKDVQKKDTSSKYVTNGTGGLVLTNTYVNYGSDDFRLTSASPAAGYASSTFINTTNQRIKITRDFTGLTRSTPPSSGAFEVSSGTSAPEINVTGNGITIGDGDTTPEAADNTDFGNVDVSSGTVTKIYTITNTGTAALSVGTVTRSGSTDFTVATQPASSVAAGGSTTFSVTFNPSTVAIITASLSFTNNDADENPYNFSIQGTGTNATLPQVSLSAPDSDANEPNPVNNGTFRFTRTGSIAGDLVVDFSVSGSATAPDDYTSLGTSTTIFAGSSTKDLPLTPQPDTIVDGNKTVQVMTLTNASYTLGPNVVAITIVDNDQLAGPVLELFDSTNILVNHGWAATNNTVYSNNFAFSASNNTDFDTTTGELGGTLVRSTNVAYFGDLTLGGNFTLADTLHANGELAITGASTSPVFDNSISIGFFHSGAGGKASRTNTLGMTLNEPIGGGQGTYRAKATLRLSNSASLPIESAAIGLTSGNSAYTFSFDYDPAGGVNSQGRMTLSVTNDVGSSLGTVFKDLTSTDRTTGATFNSFGLLTGGIGSANPTNFVNLYFDKVSYTSKEKNLP